MDEPTYRRWWALHLRVARGESLTAEEQAIHDRGVDELDQEEGRDPKLTALKQARQAVAALEAEEAQLRAAGETEHRDSPARIGS